MLLSIGAYALIWGLPFGVGFVLLLLVHEMGHVLQLRREGIKATAPMFVPFLGAFVGFFLNLFNLLPILPLDGGRAMAALSPLMWVIGFALLVAVMIVFPNPIAFLILLLGGFETWRRFRLRNTPEAKRYSQVRPATRAAVAAVYVGLAVALAIGMDLTFVGRSIS